MTAPGGSCAHRPRSAATCWPAMESPQKPAFVSKRGAAIGFRYDGRAATQVVHVHLDVSQSGSAPVRKLSRLSQVPCVSHHLFPFSTFPSRQR